MNSTLSTTTIPTITIPVSRKVAQRYNDYAFHYATMHYQHSTPSAYHLNSRNNPLTPTEKTMLALLAEEHQGLVAGKYTCYSSIPQELIDADAVTITAEPQTYLS